MAAKSSCIERTCIEGTETAAILGKRESVWPLSSEKTAKEFDKKFLGKIPLDIDLRKSSDEGQPLVFKNKEHNTSKIFLDLAKLIITFLELVKVITEDSQ